MCRIFQVISSDLGSFGLFQCDNGMSDKEAEEFLVSASHSLDDDCQLMVYNIDYMAENGFKRIFVSPVYI